MSTEVRMTISNLSCNFCGHSWIPRSDQLPKVCPKCKRTEWNNPKILDAACWYCGNPANTTDHLIPRASGGGDGDENTVRACWPCNRQKSDLSLEEWRAVMAVRSGKLKVSSRDHRFHGEPEPVRTVDRQTSPTEVRSGSWFKSPTLLRQFRDSKSRDPMDEREWEAYKKAGY